MREPYGEGVASHTGPESCGRPRNTSITPADPTPLWMMLEATYTPTPLYVNTPHPISEAYRAGLRAYESKDYDSMLRYMEQAAQVEPQSADLHYFVGEAFYALNNPQLALAAYEHSIEVDPYFAPAYVGRARVNLLLDPSADVEDDLQYAIELDQNLIDAYLDRTKFYVNQEKYEATLDDLDEVEFLTPHSPFLYLYRAQTYLASGPQGRRPALCRTAPELTGWKPYESVIIDHETGIEWLRTEKSDSSSRRGTSARASWSGSSRHPPTPCQV